MQESRTFKSIKNSSVSLTVYFINLILQFYARKIFLDYLGTEILGLNTTLTNILQFLNLAELGIGSAVGFSLYKPLKVSDYESIIDIISMQGILYRSIGFFVIAGSLIIMIFFPMIFSKMQLPIWYAYATFIVLLYSALLGYFINYKQILLSASQQEYKIQYSYKGVMILKVIAQIFCMKFIKYPYESWLICEVVFSSIASIFLSRTTKKSFPYLVKSKKTFQELRKKYKQIEIKIKQIFYHQISGFVLTQTSPFIIYAYINLKEVALYGNYNLISAGIISLMTAMFNSLIPSIGDFMITANQNEALDLFKQLFSFRFWFGSIVCFGVLSLSQPFIALWIGIEYVLPISTLYIITAILFLNIIRLGAGAFLSAMGMYSDIWAPIAEAVLNLGLSLLLGYYWGLNGILIGVMISLIIIPIIWKSFFLFHKGLKASYSIFIKNIIKHTVVSFVIGIIVYKIKFIFVTPCTWQSFIINAIEILLVYGGLLTTLYIILNFEFKVIMIRISKKLR